MNIVDRVVKGAVDDRYIDNDLKTPIGGLVPRADQIQTARRIIDWLASPADKGTIVEVPTGGGKTLIAQMVIRWILANTKDIDIAFLVSRRELLKQTKRAIEHSFGNRSVNISQGDKHTTHKSARVRILMEQTIASNIRKDNGYNPVVSSIETAGIVFVDECHHTYYQSFIDRTMKNGGRVIGLSATPDDWKLLQWFESEKILGAPQIELECASPPVLAKPVVLFYSKEGAMTKAVTGIKDEIEKEKVRFGLVKSTIANEIAQAESQVDAMRAEKGLPQLQTLSLRWLIKVTRVAHAKTLANHLSDAGFPAKAFVSGKNGGNQAEIDSIFAGTSKHNIAIVVHRFTVGYDHPGIQGLIFTNETGYPSFVQSVGRVLRTGFPPVKDEAYILDMAGNWAIHKEKYMERRQSPIPFIQPKQEQNEDKDGNGAPKSLGRPDKEILGHMAVLTLPGIQKTDCAVVDKAIVLAWCAREAEEWLVENHHYLTDRERMEMQLDPMARKRKVLDRALKSYWFATGTNIVPKGTFETQRQQANDIMTGNPDAFGIWVEKKYIPIDFKKRLRKARRKFSKSKRGM